MSGIYVLVVLAVWLGVTWALWMGWQRWRGWEGGNRRVRNAVALVVGAVWIGASFWYAGGRTFYYDMQVNRLCQQDGGIKVYETVTLPAEKFDRYGVLVFYFPAAKEPLGSDYILEREDYLLRSGNPELRRVRYRVVRRSDGKILGEGISYHRKGGDAPGPWHHSSFRCPEESAEIVIYRIFAKAK